MGSNQSTSVQITTPSHQLHALDGAKDDEKQLTSSKSSNNISCELCDNSNIRITLCPAFKRMNMILRLYKQWINVHVSGASEHSKSLHDTLFAGELSTYTISQLLDDFHHLLRCHSFQAVHSALEIANVDADNIFNDQKEVIYLIRNGRTRSDSPHFVESEDAPSLMYFNAHDHVDVLLQMFLDSIYCYYAFSLILGMILTKTEQEHLDVILSKSENQSPSPVRGDTYIKSVIVSKLQQTQTSEPGEIDNKFVTKSKHWMFETAPRRQSQSSSSSSSLLAGDVFYNIGMRFCYNSDDQDPSLIYVAPKYACLKQELIDNEMCRISHIDYNHIYNKAVVYADKRYSKLLVNRDDASSASIGIDHLMVVLLFANFMTTRGKICDTYRALSAHETVDNISKRHAHFAHIGKHLHELVHCYGMQTHDNDTFYHGLNDSKIICTSNTFCIKAPFSLTQSKQIILNATHALFDKNGLILEFEPQRQRSMPYFDCQPFADFTAEQEILTIGNDELRMLQLTNILDLKSFQEYKPWLALFEILQQLIVGAHSDTNKLHQSVKQNMQKWIGYELQKNIDDDASATAAVKQKKVVNPYLDMELLKSFAEFSPNQNKRFELRYDTKQGNNAGKMNALSGDGDDEDDDDSKLDCFGKNELPNYMDEMMHAFCTQTQVIRLNWLHFMDASCYSFLSPLLCMEKLEMIRLHRFCKLFQHCKLIEIYCGQKLNVDEKCCQYIYKFITKCNEKKNMALRKLMLYNVAHSSVFMSNEAFKSRQSYFKQIQCKFCIDGHKLHQNVFIFEW